ncbi:hypothetical protein VTK56DRAFT_7757 [Thermocarpiscus australiensis]
MNQHSTSRNPAARQPLGDATERVNNAAMVNVDREQWVGDKENHEVLKSKNASNPALAASYPAVEQRAQNAPAPTASVDTRLVNPRISTITQESRDAADSRRVSQFSNASSNASSARQLKTHIGPWQLGKTLGKGATARVRLARHRVSNQLVAVKIVAKSTAHMSQADSLANLDRIDYRKPTTSADGGLRRMPLSIEREVAILKLIRHPNIIELLDIWENRSEIYLVTEYVEKGDMFEFINWNGALNEEEAIFYFRQIMSALDYCHSFNICHRDLKPENILLKSNGQIKIADFGMAALQQNPSHQLRTACGSPHYAAPELLRHQFYKGSAVDIWSMGVILYAMLAGCLPFDDSNMDVMLAKAKRAEYRMPPHLTREAKDLIRKILVAQPAHRITMKQMWRHALIKKYDYLDEFQEWNGESHNVMRNMDFAPIPEEEIDIQILRQLKSLWHHYSEPELKEKLRDEKANDQKLFYWLLYNHREAQLENYNNNVPISKSDFHHLKPPNWGKRISTCQFTEPGRNGHARAVSRFTVISNVRGTDDAGTGQSYDSHNSSRILQPYDSQASHAKIVVHRNSAEQDVGQPITSISHSFRSYKSVAGSFRQQLTRNSQRTNPAGRLRSPQNSMGSIRSYHSIPRVRANNRSKRAVDFSRIRHKAHRPHRSRGGSLVGPASTSRDHTTHDRDTLSPPSPSKKPSASRTTATKPPADARTQADPTFVWTQELEQLGHRIAQDIDEAFRSSLLLSDTPGAGAESREASPFTLSLGTLPAARLSEGPASTRDRQAGAHPWDNRPLPPVPSQDTVSPLSIRNHGSNVQPVSRAKTPSGLQPSLDARVPERRTVSEPVYNRTDKAAGVLPSVHEDTPEDWWGRNAGRDHTASSPLQMPSRVKNKGLEDLARAENTIRVVNSPSVIRAEDPVRVPDPLKIRKVSRDPAGTKPAVGPSLLDPRRLLSSGSHQKSHSTDGHESNANIPPKKRVASWFKRASKDEASGSSFLTVTDTSVQFKETLINSEPSHPSQPIPQSVDASSVSHAQKKKSFSFSFWKNARSEPKMSLAGPELDDVYIHEDVKTICKKPNRKQSKTVTGTCQSVWSDSDDGIRKIEVQQNWLARLFRVKPAMRYLCFNILKRRARQEVAILLREWRKYGIRDVEVDKNRNIIFARVGAKNYLNLKEVWFAVELMTVIEHGKQNQLSIARFTQEKGAASSFHKVVDAISATFSSRALLVTDKRKVTMMIKTLNS